MKKGQISLEFVLATLFFILVVGGILFNSIDVVSEIEDMNKRMSVNLEARSFTEQILTSPGRHSYGSGGEDWEKNQDTMKNIEEFGLALDYKVVEKSKIDALSTVGDSKFNYSQFREVTDLENQYRFEFTSMPVVDTSSQFLRSRPPTEPDIIEPDNTEYFNAGNEVGYGSVTMSGSQFNFLTTAHDGEYDTAYVVKHSEDEWNFSEAPKYGEGEQIDLGGKEFEVEEFQNRGSEKGTLILLERKLKDFGSEYDVGTTVEKLNRYAMLKQPGAELQPLKIEVLSWSS